MFLLNYLIANKLNLLKKNRHSISLKLTKGTKIVYFLKMVDKMSQLKNRRTKITNFLKVEDKMSHLKNRGTKITYLEK